MVGLVQELKCIYSNVQSIFNKKNEIELYILENHVDVMFFTECFITDNYDASEYFFEGFQPPVVYKKNRGGACIYIRNGLRFHEVSPPNCLEDSAWIVISTKNSIKRLYGCLYRSPNSTVENNQCLSENIRWAKFNYPEVILVGDFNMPSIDWSTENASNQMGEEFIQILDELGMEQLVNQPTRFRHGQVPSLLDLLVTNIPSCIDKIDMKSPFGNSDHCVISFNVINMYIEKKTIVHRYNFHEMDNDQFLNFLSLYDWDVILSESRDLEQSYSEFSVIINKTIEKCVPLETAHQKKIAPWSNKAIQKLSRKKRKMWDKYKKSYSNEHYNLYKEILNQFNEEKYDAVKKFENNIISNKKTNPKRYYKYVSKKDKYLDRKISLKQNNVIIENNDKCAEILNNYFSSVFTSGQSEIVNDLSAFPFVPDIEDVFYN